MDRVPETMRTGVGTPADTVTSDLPATTKRMIAIVLTITRRAADSAQTLAEHRANAKAVEVSLWDVGAALRYECRRFLTGDEQSFRDETTEVESRLDTVVQGMGYESVGDMLDRAAVVDGEEDDDAWDEEDDDEEDGEDDDQDDDDEQEDGEIQGEPALEFLVDPTPCDCDTCRGIMDAHRTWNDWHPADDVEHMLKDRTDMAIVAALLASERR